MARETFHTREPLAQSVNWLIYPGEELIMVQDGFCIGQQVVSNYIMQHLFLLGFTSLRSFSSYYYYDFYYYYYYILTLYFTEFQLLNNSCLNPWILHFSDLPSFSH